MNRRPGGTRHSRAAIRVRVSVVTLLAMFVLGGCAIKSPRLTLGSAAAQDWPTFRADLSARGAVTPDQPLRIETLLWERKTGGVATHEPTVYRGLLFHTGQDRRLEIFDAVTGDRKHRNRYDGPVTGTVATDTGFIFATDQDQRELFYYHYDPLKKSHGRRIPIAQAPPRQLDDGSVLIAALHGRVMRLGMDEEPLWVAQTPGPIAAAPSVSDSLVVVSTGRFVLALRLGDGSEQWTHETGGAVLAAAAIDDRVYCGSTDSLVYALDKQSGAMQWFFSTKGQVVTTPTIGDSLVYIAGNDQSIYALDKRTGKQVWSYDTGAPANCDPTLAEGILYVATLSGKLVLLNARTGEVIRELPLTAPAATGPVIAEGRVFVEDMRRRILCFGPKPTP